MIKIPCFNVCRVTSLTLIPYLEFHGLSTPDSIRNCNFTHLNNLYNFNNAIKHEFIVESRPLEFHKIPEKRVEDRWRVRRTKLPEVSVSLFM